MHWTTWKPMSSSYFCMADLRYAIAAVTGMFRYHSRQGLLPSVRRRSGERGGRSRLSTLGRGAGLACRRLPHRSLARVTQIGRLRRQLDIVSWHRVRGHPCPSALSCFNCRINIFLRHTRASAMREGPPMSPLDGWAVQSPRVSQRGDQACRVRTLRSGYRLLSPLPRGGVNIPAIGVMTVY